MLGPAYQFKAAISFATIAEIQSKWSTHCIAMQSILGAIRQAIRVRHDLELPVLIQQIKGFINVGTPTVDNLRHISVRICEPIAVDLFVEAQFSAEFGTLYWYVRFIRESEFIEANPTTDIAKYDAREFKFNTNQRRMRGLVIDAAISPQEEIEDGAGPVEPVG